MFKKIMLFVMVLGSRTAMVSKVLVLTSIILVLGGISLADPVAKTENFDSAASAAANGWVEHNSRGGPQNFGWNSGSGGRAGGASVMGAALAADSYCYYADVFPAPLTWNDDFSVTGTLLRTDQTVKGFWMGFFNTNDTSSSEAPRMAIYMEDDLGRFRANWRTDTEQSGNANEGDWRPFGKTSGTISGSFNLAYTAADRMLRLTLNGQSVSVVIPGPTTMNAFGLVYPSSPTGGGTAKGTFYFDSLQYSAGKAGTAKITFDSESSADEETVSPVLIQVNLLEPGAGQTYTVDYTVGGTATGCGTDYTLASGTLTFNPGQTSKNISIDINNDGVDEDDETIILQLSNPTNGAILVEKGVYAGPEHTYTIIDPRPKISFAAASSSGLESVSLVLFEVTLSKPSAETLTVDYAVSGSTAVSEEEYYLPSGTLTFEPNEQSLYIFMDVFDDSLPQVDKIRDEIVIVSLSNPVGSCTLGNIREHTYTIIEDDPGVIWKGLFWEIDSDPRRLFINSGNDLEWTPVSGDQFNTHMPEQRLSQTGDVVEMTYMFMTDGAHSCPSCQQCPGCWGDSIACVDGTSDFRFGLYDWVGSTSGTRGYNARFGPNMASSPTRWVDCTNETHKTGNFSKKPASSGDLQSDNVGFFGGYIPGFELPPGQYSFFSLRFERTSGSSIRVSITLNGRTYSETDSSSSDQPQKINFFAVSMRNSRPYTRLVLRSLIQCPGDFNDDNAVNGSDLETLAHHWLLLDSPANLYEDNIIDLKDFAEFALQWLKSCD